MEPVRHWPFYCGEWSTTICVVLGPEKSSMYSSEYASCFSGPAASHLAASPSHRHEGNVGQAPRVEIDSRRDHRRCLWKSATGGAALLWRKAARIPGN